MPITQLLGSQVVEDIRKQPTAALALATSSNRRTGDGPVFCPEQSGFWRVFSDGRNFRFAGSSVHQLLDLLQIREYVTMALETIDAGENASVLFGWNEP